MPSPFQSITCKLGNMRKEADWTIYPRPTNVGADYNDIQIQSDSRICKFNATTGKGMLSAHKPHGAYNHDLMAFRGATEVIVPPEIIKQIKDKQPQKGDTDGFIVIG